VTPREVVDHLIDGVTHGRWDELPGLYAERVLDGLIVESRDHADHLAFAAATGRPADLVPATRGFRRGPASG
jgi:hypothetical protein